MSAVLMSGLAVLVLGQDPLVPPPLVHGEYPDQSESRYAFSCSGASYEITLANAAHAGPALVGVRADSEVVEADLRRAVSEAIEGFDQIWGLGVVCSDASVSLKLLGPKSPWLEAVREEEVFVRTRDYSGTPR